MSKNKIIIFSTIFLAILIGYNKFSHPLPKYKGEISLDGISNNVNVYTDFYGVPHIFSDNEQDLFIAAGYIAARERLFQMSIVNYAVKGELASVLGDELIDSDIYLRTWRIHDTAKKLMKSVNKENKELLQNFCVGINQYINQIGSNLPIEFKIIGMKAPFWDPSIVAGHSRMMAREMSSSWNPEIVYGAINEYFGKEKLAEIYPGYGVDKPNIAEQLTSIDKSFLDYVLQKETDLRLLLGYNSSLAGSNSWVLSGDKTHSGMPLLANDPHLKFTQPARWYEMHLKGGRFDVSGVCLAGIPVPIIGQNSNCAWGFTNSMVDDIDFFVESINPDSSNQYLSDGIWRNMDLIEEVIPLKSGKDTTITIRITHHGPVISDVHSLLKNTNKVVSMAWTGNWMTNELDALISLNTMKNWEDFSSAVEQFGVPGQNIIYADKTGNIGWRPAVFLPIREEGSSLIPRPGQYSKYDWKGKVPFGEMPFIFNPDKGFISTANNRTIGKSFPFYISGLWADPSRAEQIVNRLSIDKKFTVDDMKSIQLDYTSRFAHDIVPYILETRTENESQIVNYAYNQIAEWDFVESPKSSAALIFHSILRKMLIKIYGDEMSLLGENYLNAFTEMKYLCYRNLRDLLKYNSSSWIDDITTINKVENLDFILRSAVIAGINDIENYVGNNTNNWKWGRAHQLTHKHKFGDHKILNWIFDLNVGPYESGGSTKTPNAGGYSFNNPYKQISGASMRRIVDFSNLNNTQIILPTGQSGIPNSPHYRDQADVFHNGGYRTTYFSEDYIKKSTDFKHLVLKPK